MKGKTRTNSTGYYHAPKKTQPCLGPKTCAITCPPAPGLRQQRRPCRVGCVERRDNLALIISRNIDRIDPRRAAASLLVRGLLAEISQHPAVGRPGRALDQERPGQTALARSVGAHDADIELAPGLLGESDQVAARRPYRRRILAGAETDPA